MIDYDPKDASNCFPAGEYAATLLKVETSTSKVKTDGSGGNPMEVWTIRAYHGDREILVTEFVVVPAATFKIKQLAQALGKKADFDASKFQAEDYIGSSFNVELTIEEQDGYDDKNRVKRFKPSPTAPPQASPAKAAPKRTPVQEIQARNAATRAPTEAPFQEEQFAGSDIPF